MFFILVSEARVKPTRKMKRMKPETQAELFFVSTTEVLSIFNPVVGLIGKVGLWTWQEKRLNHFKHSIEERVKRVEDNKLDKSALESDELKALAFQAVEIASKTASDLKLKALANALVNSVVLPTSKIPGKQALLRVLSQMSDEEMIAFTVLYNYETVGLDEFQLTNEGRTIITYEYVFKKVKNKMGQEWSEKDNWVAFDGLAQLGLAKPPPEIQWNKELVRTTALGNRLIQWCSDEYEKEQGSGEESV